ncbi:hypothetical protein P3T18_003354 [Paraburkholderia sp. GAS199]|uniref:hypothetical protein n=1 Tax=Paraburkholderia sp. GAS199 TaxID=3035126 RepID=UPI003D22468D
MNRSTSVRALPSQPRHADTPAAVRDRRAELRRADDERAEQRIQDDARNDPSAGKWRYRPPHGDDKAME